MSFNYKFSENGNIFCYLPGREDTSFRIIIKIKSSEWLGRAWIKTNFIENLKEAGIIADFIIEVKSKKF